MIIDTMIAAYACFNVPDRTEAAHAALRKSRSVLAPDSFRAEFINVSWQYARAHAISPGQLEDLVHDGLSIPSAYLDSAVLWREAIALAVQRNHNPYDTLFVAAAVKRRSKVLTCDRKMLTAFPEYTVSLSRYVS